MKATKIKMQHGCYYSQKPVEIDSVWITGCAKPGYYKKADLYDYLQTNPGTIQVDIWPYPHLIPAVSSRGEKYVRSTPDTYRHDDLMDLPRE